MVTCYFNAKYKTSMIKGDTEGMKGVTQTRGHFPEVPALKSEGFGHMKS